MARPTKDLKDLVGDPFTDLPDVSDRPDSARIEEMRERLIERINSLPGNSASFAGWNEKGRDGLSMADLYGPAGEQRDGLDDDQRQLIYETVAPTFERLSAPQIDALDRQDQEREQQASHLWSEFAQRFPELSKDPEKVQVAIALHDDELRSYGQNPELIRRDDPVGYVRGVAEASRHVVESNGPDTRHAPSSDDDGRSSSLSYGEGSRRSAPDKREDDGDMIADLQAIQRRSGLW